MVEAMLTLCFMLCLRFQKGRAALSTCLVKFFPCDCLYHQSNDRFLFSHSHFLDIIQAFGCFINSFVARFTYFHCYDSGRFILFVEMQRKRIRLLVISRRVLNSWDF